MMGLRQQAIRRWWPTVAVRAVNVESISKLGRRTTEGVIRAKALRMRSKVVPSRTGLFILTKASSLEAMVMVPQ